MHIVIDAHRVSLTAFLNNVDTGDESQADDAHQTGMQHVTTHTPTLFQTQLCTVTRYMSQWQTKLQGLGPLSTTRAALHRHHSAQPSVGTPHNQDYLHIALRLLLMSTHNTRLKQHGCHLMSCQWAQHPMLSHFSRRAQLQLILSLQELLGCAAPALLGVLQHVDAHPQLAESSRPSNKGVPKPSNQL